MICAHMRVRSARQASHDMRRGVKAVRVRRCRGKDILRIYDGARADARDATHTSRRSQQQVRAADMRHAHAEKAGRSA